MKLSNFGRRWGVVISVSLAITALLGASIRAFGDAQLPPPPTPIEGVDTAGDPLPPSLPGETPDAGSSDVPIISDGLAPTPEEQLAAPEETATLSDVPPADVMTPEPPPEVVEAPPPASLSTKSEFSNLSAGDKLNEKNLVLWLSLGGAYGQVDAKPGFGGVPGATPLGGVGYTADMGIMVGSMFQMELNLMGLPRTEVSTVDNAMFGFGPRLGFLSFMGLIGVQSSADVRVTDNPPRISLFSYGAKASLDLVLSHFDNSRVSVGIVPEVFYVTAQGNNGFTSTGGSISLRFYGYENAF